MLAHILKVAAAMSGIPAETIAGTSRKRNVVMTRSAIIHVARQYNERKGEMGRYSFPRIAELLNRDHTSILHSYYSFDDYCKADPKLRDFARRLQQQVEARYSEVEQYLIEARQAAERERLANEKREAERAAQQLYAEIMGERERTRKRKLKDAERQREREEMMKRVRHDLIPTHRGLAKNDFKPLYEEEIDDSHRDMTAMAIGSRRLLDAILKERKRNVYRTSKATARQANLIG